MLPALDPEITEGNSPCSHRQRATPIWNSGGATGEHQAALAEGLAGGFEEIQFFLEAEFLEVGVAQVVQGDGHFFEIILDQAFGAHPGLLIETRVGDVAQVAVQAFVQVEHQLVDVMAFARLADLPQAIADQLVVVMGGAINFFPFVRTGKTVVFAAGFVPFFVGFSVLDGPIQLLESAFHAGLRQLVTSEHPLRCRPRPSGQPGGGRGSLVVIS